jgi:WD40 repeat protein
MSPEGNYGFHGRLDQGLVVNNLWHTPSGAIYRLPATLPIPPGHKHPITAIAFSSDGRLLVTAAGKGKLPGEVKVWQLPDVKTWQPPGGKPWTLPAIKKKLPEIQYTASAFFSTKGEDDLLGLPLTLREPPGVEMMALSPNGKTLVTVHHSNKLTEIGSGTAKLWDIDKGKAKGDVVIPDAPIKAVAFTPNEKTLIVGVEKQGKGEIRLWNVATGKDAGTLGNHAGPVQALAPAPDGKHLASGSVDGTVKYWDITAKKELGSVKVSKTAEPVTALRFAPNGQTLAVAGGSKNGWIKLWDSNAIFTP